MMFKQPLARAKGLGASGDGFYHWWLQRVSAVALIPLTLWFLWSILNWVGMGYQSVSDWVSQPTVAVFLILYLVFSCFHGQLGLQVVIEDYVSHKGLQIALILFAKLVMLLAAVGSVFAVLKLAL